MKRVGSYRKHTIETEKVKWKIRFDFLLFYGMLTYRRGAQPEQTTMSNLPYAVREYVSFAKRPAATLKAEYGTGHSRPPLRNRRAAMSNRPAIPCGPYYRIETHGSAVSHLLQSLRARLEPARRKRQSGAILKLLDHAHSHTEEEEQP